MQLLQEQWSQVGIEAQVRTVDLAAMTATTVSGEFQLLLSNQYGYRDPDTNSIFWEKETAQPPLIINFSEYYSEVTENALALGRTTTDFDIRKAAYTRLAQDRNEAVTDLWLYDTPFSLVGDRNVQGLNWAQVLAWGSNTGKPYLTGMWLQN
jgi:ABC-type transport system substrate-binding protein